MSLLTGLGYFEIRCDSFTSRETCYCSITLLMLLQINLLTYLLTQKDNLWTVGIYPALLYITSEGFESASNLLQTFNEYRSLERRKMTSSVNSSTKYSSWSRFLPVCKRRSSNLAARERCTLKIYHMSVSTVILKNSSSRRSEFLNSVQVQVQVRVRPW